VLATLAKIKLKIKKIRPKLKLRPAQSSSPREEKKEENPIIPNSKSPSHQAKMTNKNGTKKLLHHLHPAETHTIKAWAV
jgi:hypothetical protein